MWWLAAALLAVPAVRAQEEGTTAQPGLINLDFADVKTILTDAGSAMMGIGEGTGEHRAADG